ncbi:MAG: DUF1800 domain-containing protein [Sediminibacterium sp.]|jgi:uncharacterized protein (DUF1800 family)|uniref:DUF1800 domain-containing protein n=1 Tax=Sediminibacterium sp. TaxID=1917865 RepID=UPI002ABAD9A2|nr:DUF1800 domain-containing protein [Sediminibacterium sp.]MDZ4072068.1 DUF1800 domain-containing protein [Sediminibacterium sp.]
MWLKRSIAVFSLIASTAFIPVDPYSSTIRMPYQQAGLSKEQAAAHLLNRFSFGIQPGQIDEVVKMGLENWLQQQLEASVPDTKLDKRLADFDALKMNNEEIVNHYLTPAQIIRLGIQQKIIRNDSLSNTDREKYRQELAKVMRASGVKPVQELHRQLVNQKVLRAVYSNNQLKEVLTDFWFNHFNVSLTKGQSQQYVMSYERDAIRPHVFGNFKNMLLATAKHPAMLEYLDNALSVSNDNERARRQQNNAMLRAARERAEARLNDTTMQGNALLQQAVAARRTQGLNENYAREVMELHTMGVDGGYTQKDVTELARALTGWSVRPMFKNGPAMRLIENLDEVQLKRRGLIIDGDFLFRGDKHDESEKIILGKKYSGTDGYEEGVAVLNMLASHVSTAKFIATKMAIRFVSDEPSQALIKALTNTYQQTDGNIKAMIIAMVNHPDFWSKKALREKIKSPFEFAISALRATKAQVMQPFQVFNWCSKMGQRVYYYQAPTGFPDRANFWINSGALLNRMNFGLALATQKIPGVRVNLLALNNDHEPESADEALRAFSKILLPERDNEENIKRLTAMVRDANVEEKIAVAAAKAKNNNMDEEGEEETRRQVTGDKEDYKKEITSMAQVVGIIIGSPEFQRK